MPAHDGALDRPTFLRWRQRSYWGNHLFRQLWGFFNQFYKIIGLILISTTHQIRQDCYFLQIHEIQNLTIPLKYFLEWNVNNLNAYIFWNPSRIILVILSESLATVFNINHQIKLFVDDLMLLTCTWSCGKVFDIYGSLYFPTFSNWIPKDLWWPIH